MDNFIDKLFKRIKILRIIKPYLIIIILSFLRLYTNIISRLYIYIFYSIPFFIYLIIYYFKSKGKKIEFIYLFNSKFGHFYLNTEVYLREINLDEIFPIFFMNTKGKVDTIELKNIWERGFIFHNWEFGQIAKKIASSLNINVVNKIPTFPLDIDKFKKNKFFINLINNKNNYLNELYSETKTSKHIVFTIRDSSYQELNQNVNIQSWRNSHIKSYNKSIYYLLAQNFSTILINRNVKFALNINDKRYIDYSKSNSFSLEKELTLINQSKLYIGSCTGLDVIALTNEIDTLLINVTLGTSFQTTYLTKKTIFVPAKLYSTTYDRYLTLTEYLEYLNLLELEYKIDRFENYHQSQFGVIQIHPSEDEILESVKESLNLIDNIDFMTDDDNINQDKFWNIYPKEFPINEIKLSRKAHKTPHLAIISPYFLKKNPFFLA